MIEAITNILVQFGYVGIFLCMFIETIFPPIPSEVVLPFAGYAVYQGKLNMVGVIASGTLGSLAGAGVFYYLGRVLKEARLRQLIAKYGKWVGFKERDVEKSQAWFEKHGLTAVFFARLLPGMRSIISIPAGLHKMKPLPFFLLSLLGSLAWTLILVFGGYLLGEEYSRIATQIKPLSYIVLAVLILAVGYFIWKRVIGSTHDDEL